jgi:N-acyl homoserine lactone hydrolase
MDAVTTMSRGDPGSADPVKAVSVITTFAVRIHPEQRYGSRAPLYWWLLTSRRWTPPLPVNVYVIEHAQGLILFDTGQDRASVTDDRYFPGGPTRYLYGRLAHFDIGKDHTLTAQLATLGYAPTDVNTAIVSHGAGHGQGGDRPPVHRRRRHVPVAAAPLRGVHLDLLRLRLHRGRRHQPR